PCLMAMEMPMTSRKENRLNSSPFGPQIKLPSVSTPSTSKATALTGNTERSSSSSELPSYRNFRVPQALDAVAHGHFDQSDVSDKFANSVDLERGGLIRAPH